MIDNLPQQAEPGDQYTTPKGVTYTFDGVKWRGSIIGQTVSGSTGSQGPQGIPGPAGRDGIDGAPGKDGRDGVDGIRGERGDKGEKGDVGPQGLQGIQGPKGDTGPTGPQGDQGPAGAGISNTVVENTITFGSTHNQPVTGTRTVQRLESQRIGDKARITYKFGFAGGQAGTGGYLLTLPAGMAFNTTYHPVFTDNLWTGDVQNMAIYFIPATGGIVMPTHWSNQIMVVPYDATRFRLALTNNNSQTTYQVWHNGWYSCSSNTMLNITFEIWPTTAPATTTTTTTPPRMLGAMRPPV
jgi:hypothetical protein